MSTLRHQEQKIVEMKSVQPKNIYQRINQVMGEVEAVQKESKKVNNMYTFVSHDAVARALHGPMQRAGIVMIPSIASMIQDGNRTVVKMDIAFINIDNPEDRFIVNYEGYGIDPQDKGPGKAISYAVKYALLKTFCLETGDDVEKDNIEHVPEKKEKKPILTVKFIDAEQVKEVESAIDGDKTLLDLILKARGIDRLDQIPITGFVPLMDRIQQYKKDKK
jgi:hypothetical protein